MNHVLGPEGGCPPGLRRVASPSTVVGSLRTDQHYLTLTEAPNDLSINRADDPDLNIYRASISALDSFNVPPRTRGPDGFLRHDHGIHLLAKRDHDLNFRAHLRVRITPRDLQHRGTTATRSILHADYGGV